ncbi:MAG TPA: cyclic nucleotide-binding domain-containing protein, partial [Rhizobiaceae bacterium]|nr:cyclic nucleotide-binding domain-containing protein [Rhizobiaceae bacterium]
SISLRKGRTLYWEGGNADCAFVVASGSIALYHEADGERQVLDIMEAGSILGEFALIAEGKRLTSAAAETDSQLLRLNRTMFRRILEEYPETAVALHRRIAANLQAMIARIERVMSRF